ncbi:response regulator transcription factor [Ornithinibacillus gellani]|uniref:response regulator transcription factor n=1 Tax=Ornithinibacillus gellani TaxID=2293253 RepID=UPI000F49D625|nr:response regulator transcription factor [Ornithinibacillus gellani]TQS76241.1 response regulator transcription factor [Ornithinibacillus gellani]
MGQKILVVDDEASIVTLLTYNLEKAGFQTDAAYDGKEAVQKTLEQEYDLILLDLMLPEMDGMEVCHYLRESNVHTPIIILTAKDDMVDKIAGLEIGADDYLTKPFSPKEVLARVKAILRRVNLVKETTESVLKIGELYIYPEKYEAKLNGEELSFTRKEFELLMYLARHKEKVLSRDQLLLAVWNYDFVGDSRIVDVHISHLREKIENDSRRPQYIKTIRGLGYKLGEPKSL